MRVEDRYDSLIRWYAAQHGLGWCRIKRQVAVESSFDPKAESPAGAIGLMQFTTQTWRDWGAGGDPTNPEDSIRAGCAYMAALVGRYGEIPDANERYRFALAAYNAGPGEINTCLRWARKACGQPFHFDDWEAAGRPAGRWQIWDFASRSLSIVTGQAAAQTIAYVNRIMPPEVRK